MEEHNKRETISAWKTLKTGRPWSHNLFDYCNCNAIVHLLRCTTTYWQKIAHFSYM